ncbi:MAG: HlyC/CorC family transporter [Gammaproteobacteria bacterium]|nr:HlyC/CorC family transporter [Gammaproteobacteria bacterium]MCP5135949.1 HlyC/CorC family transporter [Gammaproteobacteria bacterium]
MDDIHIGLLVGALIVLILLSGFFSGSETGLMTLNRYRMKHKADAGHGGARRAQDLLKRPDRLIGVILLGNNFVNILASAIATVLAIRLWGEAGIAIATGLLTVVILIFSEVTPKTFAALHPERIAYPASYVMKPLLKLLYPLVWVTNLFANGLLRLLGVSPVHGQREQLSREELRAVVNESSSLIPERHQNMLLGALDLEEVKVEDIMIPRSEVMGIDIEDSWERILRQLTSSPFTRLPVYRDTIENTFGILHLRDAVHLLEKKKLDRDGLTEVLREPYFIPEATPLYTQLLNFQRFKQRTGLVVDEYGDIQGLVTLEDLLEEVVGEFTTDPTDNLYRFADPVGDGSYLVDGSANIRTLNRMFGWEFPTDGPRTLNGLILEHMETIPNPGTSLMIAGYPLEIRQTTSNTVKTVLIQPLWPGTGTDKTG